MPLEPLNVPGLLATAKEQKNTMRLYHQGNNFIYGKIDDAIMDTMFDMLEQNLPEGDKQFVKYTHEGDTSLGCHCTLFDYHTASPEVLANFDGSVEFEFEPVRVSKFVEEKWGKHKIFYCVGLTSESLLKWLDEKDLTKHMNKNLNNTLHYTIAEASWKAEGESRGSEHQTQHALHEHKEIQLFIPQPFGKPHDVHVHAGEELELRWQPTPGDDGKVKLQYALNSWGHSFSSWTTVVDSVANTGVFRWRVPGELEPDSRYYIRLSHCVHNQLQLDSDHFTVLPAKSE